MRSDKSKRKPKKRNMRISRADNLTKTSKGGHVELEEKELARVTGGRASLDLDGIKTGR
jgi:hypothetical protein